VSSSTTYERIPVGAEVRYRDAPASSARVGKLIKRLKPCVGAPYMARVEWRPGHSSPVNERNLVQVDA
jgi:hypothetical protein